MRVKNKLLQTHLEDLAEQDVLSEVSENETEGFQAGGDLEQSESSLEETRKELESVEETKKALEEVKAAQDINIQVMEEGKSPEEVIAEVQASVVSGEEGDGESEGEQESHDEAVEITEEVKEGVLSEKLPEDDSEAVDVIEKKIQNEQYVVESIYAQLVGRGTFKESTSERFAKLYGIRTNGQGLTSCQEARGTASPRQEAIRLYKVHSEAIGESIKKLGSAAWNGIKELIKKVIKFVKSIFANKDRLVQGILDCGKKSNEILNNVDLYELTDEFKKGYSEISPASVLLGVENLSDYSVNMGVACSAALVLGEMLANQRQPEAKDLEKFKYREIMFNGVVFEGEFKAEGTLYGTKFFRFDGGESSLHDCESVNLKFSNVKELAQQVNVLTMGNKDQLKRTIDQFKEIEKRVESLEKDILKFNGVPGLKESIKESLQLTKLIFQYPKVVLAAAQLGLSGIKKKESK